MSSASPATAKLRIFFSGFDPQQRPVPLAYACGLGQHPHGDYVFVRPDSLHELRVRAQEFFDRAETIGEADLVVYPHIYTESDATKEAEDLARTHNLPCAFFRNDDCPPPATIRYGVVFQACVIDCESVRNDVAGTREVQLQQQRSREWLRPLAGM